MTNVILDANILVLYAVGATRSDLLGKRRRVKEFNPRDYELLLRVLSPFGGRKLVHAAQQINCDSCNFTILRDFT